MALRYLDSLDTVRSCWGPPFAHFAKAEAILGLLLGNTIRLSQTQAFDSLQILEYSSDLDFLDLVRHGYIQILPYVDKPGDKPLSPLQAFSDRLEKPGFHFSAWTEIPTPPRKQDGTPDMSSSEARNRREIIEEAATQNFSDPSVGKMWSRLENLDHAYWDWQNALKRRGQAPPCAVRAQISLRPLLESYYGSAHHLQYLQKPLGRLLDRVQGNDRSDYHLAIRGADIDDSIKESLHSIVNLGYNTVIADSVGSEVNLSTIHEDAKEVVYDATPESTSLRVIETSDARLTELEPVSWKTVAEWVPQLAKCTEEERAKKLLDASKSMGWEIAEHRAEKSLICRIVPQMVSLGAVHAAGLALELIAVRFGFPLTENPIAKLLAEGGVELGLARRVDETAKRASTSFLAQMETKKLLGVLKKGFPLKEG